MGDESTQTQLTESESHFIAENTGIGPTFVARAGLSTIIALVRLSTIISLVRLSTIIALVRLSTIIALVRLARITRTTPPIAGEIMIKFRHCSSMGDCYGFPYDCLHFRVVFFTDKIFKFPPMARTNLCIIIQQQNRKNK